MQVAAESKSTMAALLNVGACCSPAAYMDYHLLHYGLQDAVAVAVYFA
jgi:hypothetical protein